MKLASFFWGYFRRYLGWLLVAFVATLFMAVASAGMVSLIEPMFDEVLQARPEDRPSLPGLGGEQGNGSPEIASPLDVKGMLNSAYVALKERFSIGPDEVIFFTPLLFVLVFVCRSFGTFLSGYAFQCIGLGITTNIRNDLYHRLIDQSSRFHTRHRSGELYSRVVSDVDRMHSAVSNRLFDLVQQSATLIAFVLLLLSTDLTLALVCLVAAPIFLFTIVRFGQGMRKTSHRSQERMADLSSLLAEGIRGHRIVKAFGMEDFEYERFRAATRRHLRVNLWAQFLSNLSSPVVESLAAAGGAALIMYAALLIRDQQLTAPLFIQFLINLLLLYDPIRKLNKVNLLLQEAMAAAHRVCDLLAEPNEIVDKPDARPLATVKKGITYENVSFSYDEEWVLRHFDLTIRCGEIVALVGPSGAGKTTVANLLPRFFDPVEGCITIDGIDIRELPLRNLRSLIGMVSQETVLFNDTVRNNIAYGRSDLPLERVREAAAAAYADDFIVRLPHGYDEVIGEGGGQLSGGQRQRLAIARALLKNAPILILDEATSHLDTESEALVQKALYNLMQDRTTLVIAHRLSTVARADRILVMERGRIVEDGTHEELLALGGSYKRLYDLQFKL